ncbi:hypothetical protein [Bradyrhizobium vignae]|uniref:hypothetical protein n=1 Tax=Bradyrhizobium vignae TaxID=1549949 RepID=UPI003D3140A0
MLRFVNGLLLPTRGRVEVVGLDTVRDRKDLPARVGFLFQNPDHHQLIFPTVVEEVAFGPAERGLRRCRHANGRGTAGAARLHSMCGTQRQRAVRRPEAAGLRSGTARNGAVISADGRAVLLSGLADIPQDHGASGAGGDG